MAQMATNNKAGSEEQPGRVGASPYGPFQLLLAGHLLEGAVELHLTNGLADPTAMPKLLLDAPFQTPSVCVCVLYICMHTHVEIHDYIYIYAPFMEVCVSIYIYMYI